MTRHTFDRLAFALGLALLLVVYFDTASEPLSVAVVSE